MGRISFNELENYGSGEGTNYLSLKNDKEVAKVRILYDNVDEISPYVVHEVEVDGRMYPKDVNCLRNYDDPIDMCPFCKAQMKQKVKFFIPVYDERDKKTKIWTRSKKFATKLMGFQARFVPNGNFAGQPVEIERNGAKGDTQTTYELYAMGANDGKTTKDFPEKQKVLGGAVWDKTAEEMESYLANGTFDVKTGAVRRQYANADANEGLPFDNEPVRRRVPSSNEDAF